MGNQELASPPSLPDRKKASRSFFIWLALPKVCTWDGTIANLDVKLFFVNTYYERKYFCFLALKRFHFRTRPVPLKKAFPHPIFYYLIAAGMNIQYLLSVSMLSPAVVLAILMKYIKSKVVLRDYLFIENLALV